MPQSNYGSHNKSVQNIPPSSRASQNLVPVSQAKRSELNHSINAHPSMMHPKQKLAPLPSSKQNAIMAPKMFMRSNNEIKQTGGGMNMPKVVMNSKPTLNSRRIRTSALQRLRT